MKVVVYCSSQAGLPTAVNLGIKENGLIHISQMSRRRISSVSEVLKLGQKVDVKVIGIDPVRKRIALSLLI